MTSAGGASGASSDAVTLAAERLTSYARAMSAQTAAPGGTWAVVDRAGVVAAGCWGAADPATGEPMRPDHRFEIGSISKVVTAVVVHQLVDEGLLDLDRPVTDVLPWLDLGRAAGDTADAVTPRHLLSHTAGLVLGADHLPDEAAQVHAMRDLVRSGRPGERFHYSNLGFMVLGVLAQHLTGRPWPELVEERVLAPIGAAGASGAARTADRSRMAVGSQPLHDDRPFVPGAPVVVAPWFEVASADGNVVADAAQLGALARFLLGDGEVDGVRVLSPASMAALVGPAAPSGDGVPVWGGSVVGEGSRYGLGVNVERLGGDHCVSHGGGMVGYACYLLADRAAGFGVVVLTNGSGEHPSSHPIAYTGHALFRAALAGDPVPQPPNASAAVRSDELDDDHLGTFTALAMDGTDGTDDAAGTDGRRLDVTVEPRPDGGVDVVSAGARGRLFRTWSSRLATDHPDLRTFPFTAVEGGWATGPHLLLRTPRPARALDPRLAPLVGRYRTWSPWFPTFRIVARDGDLVLVAVGGVEAPLKDEPLVHLGGGVFRIGADPGLPERLVAGPVVDGRCVHVVRDGCTYSRSPFA